MTDLISRQAAIDGKIHIQLANGVEIYSDEAVLVDYLRALPTIDPVKQGKWISVPHKKNRICSVCECDEPYKFADENVNVFDYCPHCGARMDR